MIEYSRSAVTQSNFIPRCQSFCPTKTSFRHSIASWRDRGWITQSSFQPMETDTSGWNELMLRGTYFFVASRRWTCAYIYIYTRRISNSKFSILDWSRISTVDHLRLSCALWKWFSKYEVYIYKKRWIRVLDRAILLEEEQSKVIFILCHFLDNLIRSIIKFRVSQLNRRLEIEGTDNACLTTGKLHLLSLTRDQFY